ncbi:MAG: tRNA-specific adenosine deaminase [Omnitrophica bacterium RIFCSPLOWO2_02_FULL_45_16]|nr:MAG: tRNA-specific adenosine deaminase [Omnitrophica bacterium RIFCSPHIGHO2_02_FULL_46_20]OGW94790.1 MAG: tRNA-specific adenosine deaminase [Omnitrophica bacterium RIFCSPLOWO2_12_FULL_45_13]OGX00302.1 MAG: tRNA-specific adenosine deaminase [Omnitrophica bacterium RIFCSPLOWO2_02_FULL_45_16]
MSKIDSIYMSEALKEARVAFEEDEVPVGAVIVHDSRIIARAHNQIKLLKDPTAHAEIIAITQAASYLGNERLINTTMYATIEPCSMCAGALVLARIKRLVYGAVDPKTGACGSVFNITNSRKLNHRIKVSKGILETECAALLKEFFSRLRQPIDMSAGSPRKSAG